MRLGNSQAPIRTGSNKEIILLSVHAGGMFAVFHSSLVERRVRTDRCQSGLPPCGTNGSDHRLTRLRRPWRRTLRCGGGADEPVERLSRLDTAGGEEQPTVCLGQSTRFNSLRCGKTSLASAVSAPTPVTADLLFTFAQNGLS